jgi:predicted acylesterase/phospholipase RssA
MFGAYQAGVWTVLYPIFRPDVVIGCSVGSINGWSIAGGISGEDLVRTWLDPRCAMLMSPRHQRRPWHALFDPAPLTQMVQELTSAYTPQVPFALAVTRLPRMRLELVESPAVTWQHIVASCAVPVAYPSVRIGGQSYCDGGLLSILPVWAAQSLGAHRVIAVNVLPRMPLNMLHAAVRTLRFFAPREPQVTGIEVLQIAPDSALGTVRDALTWNPAAIQRWIERGQADARRLIDSPPFAAMLPRFV